MQDLVTLGFIARYREISEVFPLEVKVKLLTPGMGPNLTPGPYLGTLGRGPPDEAACKIW